MHYNINKYTNNHYYKTYKYHHRAVAFLLHKGKTYNAEQGWLRHGDHQSEDQYAIAGRAILLLNKSATTGGCTFFKCNHLGFLGTIWLEGGRNGVVDAPWRGG